MINYIILAAISLIMVLTITIAVKKSPAKIKQWLLWAVVQAEKSLGSKTGKLKLAMVYDMFISKFGFLSKIFTFETFSTWVDEALETMKGIISNNESISNYVENKEEN